MNLAIKNLLDLGAVTLCIPCKNQFLSRIFLASKPNGGKRFILNLKPLNKFITNTHFKMEDFRTASKLIPSQGYMTTIDLREAYLLVPIAEIHQKFLRFEYEGYTYEFKALPYGLSVAPRIFTKIMKEVMCFLRYKGYTSVQYLDDILCIGDNLKACLSNVNETVRLLEHLGFVINYDKSILQPHQQCKFLGFIYDSVKLTISLPDEKRKNISRLLQKYSTLPNCTIREFAQLIGVLTAACPAARYGWLYTKNLERHKYLSLLNHNDNFDSKISLPNLILEDLNWWIKNINHTFNYLSTPEFSLEIFTDASRTGWGAVCNGKQVYGGWKPEEKEYHINFLELLAVYLALKCFVLDKSNCAILLRVDNTTAISYINRMGGIQFPHLNSLAWSIWQWCEKRQIWLQASYINTKDNKEADQASRIQNPDTEWELTQTGYNYILQQFGEPDIDLFASRTNAKCQTYVSWKPDPDAITNDAFTIPWKNYFFYAFPPCAMILKCLHKIIADKAKGIIVFPMWPSQPWYPLLMSMLVSKVIELKSHKNNFHSHFSAPQTVNKNLILGAAVLCGKRSQ